MIRSRFLILFLALLWCPHSAVARVDIPTHLNHNDRIKALDILGFGTNSKVLSDPYPLGGYAGFEAGIQVETIPVSDLSGLGASGRNQDFYSYPLISIAKGVYNNIDFFVHFIPFSQGIGISEYGGIARWGFFQMAYFPISFSLQINANSANISNQLITKNYGADLTVGLTAQSFYFYTGLGETYTEGTFIGGADGVTDSGNDEDEKDHKNHLFFGAGVHIDMVSITAQMDYFTQPNYSLKAGLRF